MKLTSTTIAKRKVIVTILLSFILSTAFSQINLVTTHLRTDALLITVSDTYVQGYLNSMQSNGSWTDIDYNSTAQTNWPAATHIERLKQISIAYSKSTSALYHQQTAKDKLLLGMRYYYTKNPTSTNWYYGDIEVPLKWGIASILMKTGDNYGFVQDTLTKYATVMHYDPQPDDGGANKIWINKVGIYKACVLNDATMITTAFNNIADEISYAPTTDEGIKVDYTFYQHTQSMYNGGYATGFLRDASWAVSMAAGTTYAFTTTKVDILENLAINLKWLLNKNVFDYGVSGRGISSPNGSVVSDLSNTFTQIINANGPHQAELEVIKDYIDGNVDFPGPGNRHFWKGDMVAQHGPDWYVAVKVSSSRVTASEVMNGENLKGKYVGITHTCVMTNGNEYKGTQAVWDWSRLSGTTCENGTVAKYPANYSTYINSGHSFSGGVSDSKYGFAAVNHTYDGVNGKKAYLLTDEGMYCIGNSITSTKQNVLTNVEQCLNQGTVTINNGSTSTYTGTSNTYTNLNWVHQNNVGYYFPSNGNITLRNQDQTGNFYDINTTQSATNITKKMFSVYFDHGDAPANKTYEYMIVPGKTLAEFQTWTSTSSYSVISNTNNLQAIKYGAKGVYGVAFYAAGSVTLETDLTVSVDRPCLFLMQTITNGYKISVADPTQLLTGNIVVTISKELLGTNATIGTGSTAIAVALPGGDYKGKSISNDYYFDIQAPSVPTNIEVERVTTTTANISWSASTDNVGVVLYLIYLNGAYKMTSTTTTATVTGLAAGTEYSFSVKARDAAANYSALGVAATASTASTCSGGPIDFTNTSFTSTTGTFTVEFDAVPGAANMDGCVSVNSGAVTAYTAMACIVRFYTNGNIDVRNGTAYAAVNTVPYTAQTAYHFRMVVNTTTDKYDVYVRANGGAEQTLATQYAFRNTVTSVSSRCVKTESGCIAVSNFMINGILKSEWVNTADMDLASDVKLTVYPNPVVQNKELTIDFGGKLEKATVEIFDLLGKKKMSKTVYGESQTNLIIDKVLHSGIYFIRISDGKMLYNHKLEIIK